MDKFLDICKAFCCIVVPPLIMFITICYGITVADMVINQATGITCAICIILALPMGWLAALFFSTGLGAIGMGLSNIKRLSVNGEIIFYDKNPFKTSSSVGAGVVFIFVKLIVLVVMVPLSIIIWLINVVKILCGNDFEGNISDVFEKPENAITAILLPIAVVMSSLVWIPVSIHNKVQSPHKYDFQVTAVYMQETNYSYTGYIDYTVSNTQKADSLLGDVIICSKETNRQVVVEKVPLIPLELQGKQGTGNATIRFWFGFEEEETYRLLNEDYKNLQVIFSVAKPVEPVWVWEYFEKESEEYSYEGKYKLIAKDFGE